AALMKARPVPQFVAEIRAHATAGTSLTPGALTPPLSPSAQPLNVRETWGGPGLAEGTEPGSIADPSLMPRHGFALRPPETPPISGRFHFEGGIAVEANAAIPVARGLESIPDHGCAPALDAREEEPTLSSLSTLKPLGQIRNSFILAVNEDGLWIV